jgi:hypothetical protein
MGFSTNVSAYKQQAQALEKKSGGYNQLKFDKVLTEFFVLGVPEHLEAEGVPWVLQTQTHQLWQAGKLIKDGGGSPTLEGEEDVLAKFAWELKDKYADSGNKKLEELYKVLLPSRQIFVNVVDMHTNKDTKERLNVKDLSKVCSLPKTVFEYVESEFDEYGFDKVFDLETGCHFKVLHNGGKGFQKKYIKMKTYNNVALISKNKINEEELIASMYDLRKLQPAYNEGKYNAYKEFMISFVKKKIKDLKNVGPQETDFEESDEKIEGEETFDFDS